MPIQPGQTLSHYRILEKIGEGGMGEVYRATDTALGRDVAVKVLPEDVARDPVRLGRFQREAHLLAALNHPNIAAIYGLEEVEGLPFLALELVEGEDLSERLQRGALPVEEAVECARQIAEALEEAHERGIIHRDLKPANIKRTPEGRVKVLDFGLAKALESAPTGQTDLSMSPTMTTAATRAGVLLGTAAYMSPEQARGDAVDRRADIWAFGCVLLEMLTGRGTFTETTISDTLASILKTDPDWEALPRETPAVLRRLLRRCLQKDPRRRLRDIGEARILLEDLRSGAVEETAAPAAAVPSPRGRLRRTAATAGLVVLAVAVTAVTLTMLRPGPPAETVQKFEIVGTGLEIDDDYTPCLSPDGRRIVYGSEGRLWVRDLDKLEPRELPGTQGAVLPFWSPAADQIGYVKDGSLWKVPLQGGQAAAIATGLGDSTGGARFSWGADGRIVYSMGSTGLFEVAARGGEPHHLLDPDPEEESDLHHPQILPGGRGVLFVAHRLVTTADTLVLLTGGERKVIFQTPGHPIWMPVYAASGHILYHRRATNPGLWALPFSLSRLEVTGEPFLIAPDGSMPSVAPDGSLAYVRGAGSSLRQLVWVGRDGTVEGTIGQPQALITFPSLSPDGRRVAVRALENENWDIWIHDTARGTRTRLTFTAAQDWDPEWTPDGGQVLFWDGDTRKISSKAADGTGDITILVHEELADSGVPTVSPDGKTMIFWGKKAGEKEDLYVMPLEGDGKPALFLGTAASEANPRISPDGSIVAYTSDESGRTEVYLTRFPQAEGKWQVSVNGGQSPQWGPGGERLYYREGNAIMEVDVQTRPTVLLGTPRRLFGLSASDLSANSGFDIAPDGERLVLVQQLRQEGIAPSLVLVRNWLAEFQAQP